MSYQSIIASTNRVLPYSNSMEGLESIRQGVSNTEFTKTAQDILHAIEDGSQVDFSSLFGDEEMTVDQFKDKVSEIISSFPRDASKEDDSVAIHITDEGFENMMSDKDYTNWVLNKIKNDFSASDPKSKAMGGAFDLKYFGAAVSNYAADFWYAGTSDSSYGWNLFNTKSKGSFWQTTNSNMEQMQLLARAQAKQTQMAAQAAAAQWQAAQDAKK